MAKQNGPQMHGRKDTVTILKDIHGDIIMEAGLHKYSIKDSKGALIRRQVNETIQLVDGLMWNPGLMVTDKIFIGVCDNVAALHFFGDQLMVWSLCTGQNSVSFAALYVVLPTEN